MPQRHLLSPGAVRIQDGSMRGTKISPITSIQDNCEGPSRLQNSLRSAEVFVATTSQFSYSIFPFLLPSLPHVSVLRSLFSKPIACRAPLQSLHPRKLHLRRMMRSALKESKAEGRLGSASLLLWS